MDVEKLVNESRLGNEESFQLLFEMSHKVIFFKVNKIVMEESASLDIVQNTYIKAYNNLNNLKEPKAFLKWLNMIATNETKDYLKKKRDINLSALDSSDNDIEFEIEDESLEFRPEAQANIEETKNLINQMIKKLPETQRVVLIMFYFEELKINEIAKILDINTNTVKSRLRYARDSIEKDVLELEKNSGVKLYGFAPLAFFVWYLKEGVKSQTLTKTPLFLTDTVAGASSASANAGTQVVTKISQLFTPSTILGKAVIGTAVSASLMITSVAGVNLLKKDDKPKSYHVLNKNDEDIINKNEDDSIQENDDNEEEIVDDLINELEIIDDNSTKEESSNTDVNKKEDNLNKKKDEKVSSPKEESPMEEKKPSKPEVYIPTEKEKEALQIVNNEYKERQAGMYWVTSRQISIDVLKSSGYTEKEAIYAVDNSDFDWNYELIRSAQYFNAMAPKSYDGLMTELLKVHSKEDAKYAVDNVDIDWNRQPFAMIDHLKLYDDLTRQRLLDFLPNLGKFNQEEVDRVMRENTVDWKGEAIIYAQHELKSKSIEVVEEAMIKEKFTPEEISYAKQKLGY